MTDKVYSVEEITEASLAPVLNAIEHTKNAEVIDCIEVLKKLSNQAKD